MSDMQLVIICSGVVILFNTYMFYLVRKEHDKSVNLTVDSMLELFKKIKKLEDETALNSLRILLLRSKKSCCEVSDFYKKEEDDALSTKST